MARIWQQGIPINFDLYSLILSHRQEIRSTLIKEHDEFQLYDQKGRFVTKQFIKMLLETGRRWPLSSNEQPKLDDSTFKDIGRRDPAIKRLRELRRTLSQLQSRKLEIGPDNRNRTHPWPFATKTGRNAPSNSKFIYGAPKWFRNLINPDPGAAIITADWSGQEFAIQAAMSNDKNMQNAYRSGDPYMWWAREAGAAPSHATRISHPEVREMFKVAALAISYGQGPFGLSVQIDVSPAHARAIREAHHARFRRYWEWVDRFINHFLLAGSLYTRYGWQIQNNGTMSLPAIQNWPLQSNGAEMMRLAAIMLTEAGIKVCASIHDAFVVECALEEVSQVRAQVKEIMEESSQILLHGFRVRVDTTVTRPQKVFDEKSDEGMFATVVRLLGI